MPDIARHRSIATAFLSLALATACVGAEPGRVDGNRAGEGSADRSAAVPPRPGVTGTYRLLSVGGESVPIEMWRTADRPCTAWLQAGRYELAETRWIAVDTLLERCADRPAAPDSTWVRQDTGVFRLRGDTIQFEVLSPGPGEARVVLLGLLRGDTLTAWGSDLDGGDYLYVAGSEP